MELRLARKYLRELSKGIDPVTHSVLPDGDCCMQREVQDALKTIYKRLNMTNEEKGFPEKHGESWSSDEDKLLSVLFDQGKSEDDICAALQRSAKSVRSRLRRIGKIERR